MAHLYRLATRDSYYFNSNIYPIRASKRPLGLVIIFLELFLCLVKADIYFWRRYFVHTEPTTIRVERLAEWSSRKFFFQATE
jgi:hypothetical protein